MPHIALYDSLDAKSAMGSLHIIKSSRTKSSLRKPNRRHQETTDSDENAPCSEDQLFSCNVCFFPTTVRENFVSHMALHDKIVCRTCSTTFVSYSNRAEHEKTHADVFRYHCPYCNRPFNHKTTYIGHVNMHKGCRPFKCYECGRSFTYNSALVRHKKCYNHN